LFFNTIIYRLVHRYERDNKLKELLKNIDSLSSYQLVSEDMADFACGNPPSRNFVNIGAYVPYDTSK